MVAAIDLRMLGTASHIGREVSVEEAFADTFDQAVTLPEGMEAFAPWAVWMGVVVPKVHTEGDIMLGLLAMSPFFQEPSPLRTEARYEVQCHMFGGEGEFLKSL
jgi:hypothetical protein